MSLATRCTACGTVFRVVQDQLKISEGWVRCGRCKEVFNALEGLFDLQRDAPPEWRPAPTPAGEEPAAAAGVASAALRSAPAELATLHDAPRAPAHDPLAPAAPLTQASPAPPAAAEPFAAPAPEVDSAPPDALDFADARFDTELPVEEASAFATTQELVSEAPAAAGEAPAAEAADAAPAEDTPAFLREAAAAERWRRPRVRVALGAAALLLAASLGAQWALHFRDTVAARWPALQPPLAAACEALGCRLEPPRRIEDIAVESSALTRAAAAGAPGDALRLVVALRNRGSLALALPHVDLSLTDANGELIARRALGAADFRVAAATLAPSSETTLQALLANPGGRVAGYTVEIFYP